MGDNKPYTIIFFEKYIQLIILITVFVVYLRISSLRKD